MIACSGMALVFAWDSHNGQRLKAIMDFTRPLVVGCYDLCTAN